MADKPEGIIIRVTLTRDYFLPMATATHSDMNGWTPAEVLEQWFKNYPINNYHAARDSMRLGGSDVDIGAEILTMKEAYP